MRHLFALLFMLLSAPALATELWGGAHAGMSVEQVEAVFPEASRDVEPSTYANGSTNELTMPGPTLSGFRFRVDFTFHHGKLTDVRLRLDEKRTFDEVGALVQEIRQGLTAKYGAPISWEERLSGVMPKYDGSWRHEGVLIGLHALAVADNPATVQIRYHQPLTHDAL